MNIGKTQAIIVLPRGLDIPPDPVVMCNSRPLQLVTSNKFLGVFLDYRLSWEAQILHRTLITRKVSQKIVALLGAGQQLTLPAKRIFYMAIIAADIECGSNAFYSSLSTASKEKLIRLPKRGVRAIFRAPPLTPSLSLFQELQICRLPQRIDYREEAKCLLTPYTHLFHRFNQLLLIQPTTNAKGPLKSQGQQFFERH